MHRFTFSLSRVSPRDKFVRAYDGFTFDLEKSLLFQSRTIVYIPFIR